MTLPPTERASKPRLRLFNHSPPPHALVIVDPKIEPCFTDHARKCSCFSIWVSLLPFFSFVLLFPKVEDSIGLAIWGLAIRAVG